MLSEAQLTRVVKRSHRVSTAIEVSAVTKQAQQLEKSAATVNPFTARSTNPISSLNRTASLTNPIGSPRRSRRHKVRTFLPKGTAYIIVVLCTRSYPMLTYVWVRNANGVG
jgi:hypothetical protein